jgi:ribose transport system substrate-binding protein
MKFHIAVIPKAIEPSFWEDIKAGVDRARHELDDQGIRVSWHPPAKNEDRNSQIQALQHVLVQKPDVLVLSPIDAAVMNKRVWEARDDGLGVIIFDSPLSNHENIDVFVASDNELGGRLCAQEMLKHIPVDGSIIILRMMEGALSTTKRESAFFDEIQLLAPQVKILQSDVYVGTSFASAQRASQLMLNKYGDVVDGIFCSNETILEGALSALRQLDQSHRVALVGFDANSTLLDALKGGEIKALARQNPKEMGYMAVSYAAKLLNDEPLPSEWRTAIEIITKESLKNESLKNESLKKESLKKESLKKENFKRR